MKTNLCVLIVDDDSDDRNLFIEAVKDVDDRIECVSISNGEEALAYLKDNTEVLPDCIFLDLRMPRISGKSCLIEIKNDERLSRIPVYVYTTSKDEAESREMKRIGAFHFISKPNNDEEIYFLIACAIEEQMALKKAH